MGREKKEVGKGVKKGKKWEGKKKKKQNKNPNGIFILNITTIDLYVN